MATQLPEILFRERLGDKYLIATDMKWLEQEGMGIRPHFWTAIVPVTMKSADYVKKAVFYEVLLPLGSENAEPEAWLGLHLVKKLKHEVGKELAPEAIRLLKAWAINLWTAFKEIE